MEPLEPLSSNPPGSRPFGASRGPDDGSREAPEERDGPPSHQSSILLIVRKSPSVSIIPLSRPPSRRLQLAS